jgi:hypothetical protein
MKIKMLTTERKAGGGFYEPGEVYDFPPDVARRWIEQGKAEAAKQARAGQPPKEETG